MYKDKVKQKEANRRAAQRKRDKAKGMTQVRYDAQGMTPDLPQGMTIVSTPLARDFNTLADRCIEQGGHTYKDGECTYCGWHEILHGGVIAIKDECPTTDDTLAAINIKTVPSKGGPMKGYSSRSVKNLTRVQLDQAIRAYPHDQWINSPEHKELLRRLHTMTVAELEADGYHVPAWKQPA